ncbi:MAG: DegT/DnrJ/EryC1/StrS family aminotransferase [Nitrospinota bacterium]|nr:DegT/DnrJ/EryC1/StrS family aminotransferase [Nitrospinota bacterium]
MSDRKTRLALVLPVYGNEKSLPTLYQRIVDATKDLDVELTIQFVNDRSPDNSQQVIEELCAQDSRVRGLLLSKNHGSFVAIVAGLHEVRDQDCVVILAADLQDPPEKIPELLAKWREGVPVVLGVRGKRNDDFVSVILSKMYHRIYRRWVMKEMPEGGFDFCLIDRKVVDVVYQSSEKNTSLIGLIIWAGFDRAYVTYDREERIHGKSMWSFRKKIDHAINGIVAFSATPLKFFSLLGVIFSLLSLFLAFVVLRNYYTGLIQISGWTSLTLLLLLIASFQFLAFGVLGEYFWNNLEQSRKRPLFIVEKKIGGKNRPGRAPLRLDGQVLFFDVHSASSGIERTLEETANRALRSSRLILGQMVERFEQEFSSVTSQRHTIGVANGTDAITLALWACGVGEGDVVITSALSAPPTAVAIIRAGAKPLFVDVDPETLLISPEALEKAAATAGARAVVPVHIYGNPCDMEAICQIAEKYNLVVVEDCAQSFGTMVNDKHCGSYSHAAAFSFYPTKNLGGYGDGGAVTTNDPKIADTLRQMRFYGQNAMGEAVMAGMNSRLDEMQAGLLLDRLKTVEGQNEERKSTASMYDHQLGFLNPAPSLPGRSPHLYVVRPSDRVSFRAALLDDGVQTGIHYPLSLNRHEYFIKHGVVSSCPVAEEACGRVVSLPLRPGMTDSEIGRVIAACERIKSRET